MVTEVHKHNPSCDTEVVNDEGYRINSECLWFFIFKWQNRSQKNYDFYIIRNTKLVSYIHIAINKLNRW